MVPGCKVPLAASLCIALPGRCGAWGTTLCSVSLPSWFPEVDSEARILGRPVVLLSLYLRIRQDGGGGRCLGDDSLHSPFHPHELALHRPRMCLSAHGSCAIGPECPVTGSGHQNTQTTKLSRNQPLTQSLAIERDFDSPTSGHSRSSIRFLQAPSSDGHSFLLR